MAEILGIVASSIQLADAALKIGDNVYKFVDNIRSAPKKVAIFRSDLDQTLDLLKDIRSSLEIAKTKYNNLGDTAKLVENTLEDFNRELAECLVTVEALYAQSKKWKYKIKIGFKGEGEWVRIDARIKVQYSRLTAASGQLSNKLALENGERLNDIGSRVTTIGLEITQKVSEPICEIQNDVQILRTAGDTSILLIQESMALQISHMNRVEKLHGEQFQRVSEIHDTVISNQVENTQVLARIEDTCDNIALEQENQAHGIRDLGGKFGDLVDKVRTLEDELRAGTGTTTVEIATQSQAVIDGLKSLNIPLRRSSKSELKPRDERLELEKRKRKLSSAVRSILRLAEDPSKTKLVKGDDAEDYLTAVQELLEILQDDSDNGQDLQQELSTVASQLLGNHSLYFQRAPDATLAKRINNAENRCDDLLSSLEVKDSAVDYYRVKKVETLDSGTLVVSSASQRRTAADQSDSSITSNRTTVTFLPTVLEGESKHSWVVSFVNTFGTEGTASVPLLIRIHNRRFYDPSDDDSAGWLATKGDLVGLQKLFSTGLASVYDTDQNGSSLLHFAVSSLKQPEYAHSIPDEAKGCLAVCKFLLDQGADANFLDDKERTPLNNLSSIVFDRPGGSAMPDVEIASTAFYKILESGIKNRASPFGPERAIANLVRGLTSGSSYFLGRLLSRLNSTEFDINCYDGSNNAIMLEFATVPACDPGVYSRNCDIAIKYGADINARTWATDETCLHLLLKSVKLQPNDPWVKSEKAWTSYAGYHMRTVKMRLKIFLELGADIYARDEKYLEYMDGRNIHYTVTRDMYIHEAQDTWWECLGERGHTKEVVIAKEAEELGISQIEYENYLEGLSRRTFEARQKVFGQ